MFIHSPKLLLCYLEKSRKASLLIEVGDKGAIFKNVKKKINEDVLTQRFYYRFPDQGVVDQLENVFVFDIETYNQNENAETYEASFYEENCLREMWKRELTPDEKKRYRKRR